MEHQCKDPTPTLPMPKTFFAMFSSHFTITGSFLCLSAPDHKQVTMSIQFFWWKWISPQPWPNRAPTVPRFQSHRGFHSSGCLENSRDAFREARQRGAKICECDVQLTQDEVPVVFHDELLSRIFGHPGRVQNLRLAELKSIGPIWTLEEVLRDSEGPEFFNIELKTRRFQCPLAPKIADIIIRLNMAQRIFFSSFNPFALMQLSDLLPEVPRALLATNAKASDNHWYLRHLVIAPFCKVHMLNLDQSMLELELLSFWRRQGMPLSGWTVNSIEKVKWLWAQGVASVISD